MHELMMNSQPSMFKQFIYSFFNNVDFILIIFIVLMISACFFGRQVVIQRKMVIYSVSIIVIQIVITVLRIMFIYRDPVVVEALRTGRISDEGILYIEQAEKGFAILTTIFLFLYAFVFYLLAYKEKRVWRAIESTICFILFHGYGALILIYAYIYFNGGNPEVLAEYTRGTGLIYFDIKGLQGIGLFFVSLVVLLWLYFGFFRKRICHYVRIRARILLAIWMLLLVGFLTVPLDSELINIEPRYDRLSMLFGCLVPFLGLAVPMFLVLSASKRFLKEKSDHQEKYLEAELEYVKRYKDSQTQTRAFRHDIANQLTLTNMLMENGKLDEAKEHLQELLGNVQALSPRFVTGDEMLDCIVSMKAEKMEELGIAFTLDGVVDGGLGMKPMDVCAVFANALDNAIEAARDVDPLMKPGISMQLKRTPQFFVIKITNSAKGKIDVEKLFAMAGYTTKKDAQYHGFGLRNIHQHVEVYDGLIKAESMEDAFELSIMIPKGEVGGDANKRKNVKEEKKYA